MHRCDFKLSLYSSATTFNPPSSQILCAIVQDRAFRFKQIWCFVNSPNFGTSGRMQAYLRFWEGSLPFQNPVFSTTPLANNVFASAGLEVARFPAAIVLGSATPLTLGWGQAEASSFQPHQNSFTYEIPYLAPNMIGVGKTLDVEIVCDFMTLDIFWDTNQYAPTPALLACIGSTHAPAQYPDYNFSPV